MKKQGPTLCAQSPTLFSRSAACVFRVASLRLLCAGRALFQVNLQAQPFITQCGGTDKVKCLCGFLHALVYRFGSPAQFISREGLLSRRAEPPDGGVGSPVPLRVKEYKRSRQWGRRNFGWYRGTGMFRPETALAVSGLFSFFVVEFFYFFKRM